MSFALDANVLIYASDSGSRRHAKAVEFLRSSTSGSDRMYLPWPVLAAYVRISTHPAILRHPLSHDEALENVESLLRLPHCRALGEGEGFWSAYRECTRDVVVRGNLVSDAVIAAILREHGVRRLYTNDRDFRKFDFLEVVDPFRA